MTFDSYGPSRSRHAAFALAAAIALAGGAALIATSGGAAKRTKIPGAAAAATTPTRAGDQDQFPHTPTGAVAAATAWCMDIEGAFFNGGWVTTISALGTSHLRRIAERTELAAARAHRRLMAAHTPFAARVWPLAYAVQQYSATSARVRVWQVYAIAIASPGATTGFQTTTVSLQWSDGTWKIADAPGGPDLTPPGRDANPGQVASWIDSTKQLKDYQYAP
ncbi:MAG TPA: hypothetical protein VIJ20_04675 [Solirubrobacteraceae bacterium]